jgi:hypothetical protein
LPLLQVELTAVSLLPRQLFKTYSIQALGSGLTFVQDLKLGHYMKIPPRATFMGTFPLSRFHFFSFHDADLSVYSSTRCDFHHVVGAGWRKALACPYRQRSLHSRTTRSLDLPLRWRSLLFLGRLVRYFPPRLPPLTSSLSADRFLRSRRGLIGPARQFSGGKYYNPILYWLLAGAILPAVTWVASRRFKNSWIGLINIPVALTGISYVPPASGINYSSWFLVGFLFRASESLFLMARPLKLFLIEFIARRRHFRWWSKFTFILSASLDAGTVLSGIVIFLTLQLPKNGSICAFSSPVSPFPPD